MASQQGSDRLARPAFLGGNGGCLVALCGDPVEELLDLTREEVERVSRERGRGGEGESQERRTEAGEQGRGVDFHFRLSTGFRLPGSCVRTSLHLWMH